MNNYPDMELEEDFSIEKQMEMAQVIEPDLFEEIENLAKKAIEDNPDEKKVLIKYDTNPISFEQSLMISKTLTHSLQRYIVVLPASKIAERKGLSPNFYCEVIGKVTAIIDENLENFELFKSIYVLDRKRILFMSENMPTRWNYDMFNSFKFEMYSYICATPENQKFIAFVDRKLHIGEDYRFIGFVFDIRKADNPKLYLGKRQTICFVNHVESIVSKIQPEVLEKMKGRDMHWFEKSVLFPFHNTQADYGTLITLNLFHIWTGFPFNILVIGPPATGKTKVLQKIAAITGENVTGSSASTMKGFLPTFGNSYLDAGILATSRYKALVNEFFEMIAMINDSSRSSYFAKLKDTLEGLETEFVSGLGKMKIRMKCDLIGVGQPPHKVGQRGAVYDDIIELYRDFDAATLDRILFFQLGKAQDNIIRTHAPEVDRLLTEAHEDFDALDYGDLLRPEETKQILSFLKRVHYKIDWEYLREADKYVYENTPAGIFSRRIKFLVNMATAWAVIRGFSDGKIINETQIVEVSNGDIDKAKNFLTILLNKYISEDKTEKYKKRESLTVGEQKLYQIIENRWMYSKDKYARKITMYELEQKMDRMEVEKHLPRLIGLGLVLSDNGEGVMYYPDISIEAEKVLYKLSLGQQPNNEQEEILVKKMSKEGLVTWDDFEKWKPLWIIKFDSSKFEDASANTMKMIDASGGKQNG